MERFLGDLYHTAKDIDSDALVTYVNYPSAEYLQLPWLDFHSYNVYLEQQENLEAYLSRLQSIADYKPLVMAEMGLDSLRHGTGKQALSLGAQIRSAFTGGCAGVFVFSWTDEWHTGGMDVHDWRFGLTDAGRQAKPALAAVAEVFGDAPLNGQAATLPKISVVVCTYNGARTIRRCLEHCARLDYSSYETIVVNDGSTDATAQIVSEMGGRLISTENQGLSCARNTGLQAASGQIIAYLDDDAYPDPHWLRHLAHTFMTSEHVGVGGPNIVPPDDGLIAQCVARSPGGPTHVLITDRVAEHIPGCNMAFRVEQLREIGGFDGHFRIAGDDVDVCWRLQARGWTLGFNPAAVVWHRRRNSIRAYWKQQLNYGRAEAMLEMKWPEKYNALGHVGWAGRLYGTGMRCRVGLWTSRIYYGVWATGAFQSLSTRPSPWASMWIMPEWYLAIAGLFAVGVCGLFYPALLLAIPLGVFAFAATAQQVMRDAAAAEFSSGGCPRWQRIKRWATTALLHFMQPVARLCGRLDRGLTPWRRRTPRALALPLPRSRAIWSEKWQTLEERLRALEVLLRGQGAAVRRGCAYDDWDFDVRGGLLAGVCVRTAVEEYPGGRQQLRFRCWPRLNMPCIILSMALCLLAVWLLRHSDVRGFIMFMAGGTGLLVCMLADYGAAAGCLAAALRQYDQSMREPAPVAGAVQEPATDGHDLTTVVSESGLTTSVNGHGLTVPVNGHELAASGNGHDTTRRNPAESAPELQLGETRCTPANAAR